MREKDIDKLINDSSLASQFKSGWCGLKIKCELHESGISNMTAQSQQEYCNRIPKRSKTDNDVLDGEEKLTYKKGKPRPKHSLLSCGWRVCPKLKDLIKKWKANENS